VVQSRTIQKYLPIDARQEGAQTVFFVYPKSDPLSENQPLKGLSDTLAAKASCLESLLDASGH
jgi:hypothetical protein